MAVESSRAAELARLFRVMGDQTRLRVLMTLQDEGEMNVTQLHRKLEIPQPTVSHHLGVLRMNEFVKNRREGKEIFYSINGFEHHPAAMELKAMLEGTLALRMGELVLSHCPEN